jgi:hypothetical protein
VRELAQPNQTVKSQHVSGDISAPWNRINLLFASLKPCGLAGHFAYNNPQFEDDLFLGHKGPPRIFAHENYVGQGAQIFTICFSL